MNAPITKSRFSRRTVLKGGALTVGFALTGLRTNAFAQGAAPAARVLDVKEVDAFLAVNADGSVTLFTGKVDLARTAHRHPNGAEEGTARQDQICRGRYDDSTRESRPARTASSAAACSGRPRRSARGYRAGGTAGKPADRCHRRVAGAGGAASLRQSAGGTRPQADPAPLDPALHAVGKRRTRRWANTGGRCTFMITMPHAARPGDLAAIGASPFSVARLIRPPGVKVVRSRISVVADD